MPNQIRNIHSQVDDEETGLIVDLNLDIPLPAARGFSEGLVRGNLYRAKSDVVAGTKLPVLMTYAPYGKDIPYTNFHAKSFSELPADQKSKWSVWETPEPTYWAKNGYAVLRVDERGFGQSPGFGDTMSSQTASDFALALEWAASQDWCNGKVALLGISYYAGTQWRVAAHRPKGLACIIPWEGMSDYYRDRTRHGGILSNAFVDFWWNRQVVTNLYGLPGRAARNWGPDTIEGDLPPEELVANRASQPEDLARYKYLSEPYFASKTYDLGLIDVPVLSVPNWGGSLLHLRGNVEGYAHAGTKQKWIRFITGRHDMPFYLPEWVELQKSFLDAFVKGEDRDGWTTGKQPAVKYLVRQGNPGFNKTEAERSFPTKEATAWPIPSTQYIKWHINTDKEFGPDVKSKEGVLTYKALGGDNGVISFASAPVPDSIEITGHIVARLTVSLSPEADSHVTPKDLDLFLTLRHLTAAGEEVFYTGTAGDPVPITKGWLRCSLRKVNESSPLHRPYLPRREYIEQDVEWLEPGKTYTVDIEIWPTNVVLDKGDRLVFEVASGDTQGIGIFAHNLASDRSPAVFGGNNHIHFGPSHENYVLLPVIPATP